MLNRIWHTTTKANAATILASGFEDRVCVRRGAPGRAMDFNFGRSGVWFSTTPAIDSNLFDGVGMFDFNPLRQAFLRVDVVGKIAGDVWADESWTAGKQFIASAVDINVFPVREVSLEDALRARIAYGNPRRKDLRKGMAREPYDDDDAAFLAVLREMDSLR